MAVLPPFNKMLHQLVGIPSISSAQPELDSSNLGVCEVLASWLDTLGFNIEMMPVPAMPGKYNLIATLGCGPGGLVLAGHTDTVPCNEELWQSNPWQLTERQDKFFGLGSADMKGFFPIALAAAQQFQHQQLKHPLIILATADEESTMSGAQALVAAGKPHARYAIIGEPTDMQPVRLHKGIMMERLKISGSSGHSSDPTLGANALEAMHQAMGLILDYRQQLQQRYQHPGFSIPAPTLNLGHIHGGDNPNRICGDSELHFDLRPLPGMEIDQLRQELRNIVAPVADKFKVSVKLEAIYHGVPPFENDANSELVTLAEKLSGHDAQAVAFCTEAPYFQQLGMDTIVMGPGHIDQAHQPNEFLPLAHINPMIKLLTQVIHKLCVT